MLVARHRTKPLVSRQILSVVSRKHLFETGIVKERNRLRPVTSRQIRKVEKVTDFPEAGVYFIRKHRHLKRQFILPPVRHNAKRAGNLLSRLHPRRVKTVKDLVLTAAETLRDTGHPQVGSSHCPFRHRPFRSVHEKSPLTDCIGMKGQRNARAGKLQRTVTCMKFAF